MLSEIQANQSNLLTFKNYPINQRYKELLLQKIPRLADVEGNLSVKKKTEDDENLFFKALTNRFWLASKNCSWFNKVVPGRSSIKWTSWKGNV